ncbi:MAG TPA: hypothetical protein VFH75_01820 [Actinomycetota bacterium]|nr:hypothetical protein [Actinomycetota bacterium]
MFGHVGRHTDPRSRTRGRSLAMFVTGAVAAGIFISPAGAHVEDTVQHLINDHLKVFFYTKKVANERFISFAEKVVDSDNLDGRDSSLFLGDTLTIVRHDQIQPGQMETKIVGCPPGYEAVGGGVDFGLQTTFAQGVRVVANGPRVEGDRAIVANDGQNAAAAGWFASLHNQGTETITYAVTAICAQAF